MMNQVVLIGKIVNVPELRETTKGKKVANISLKIPREYTNSEGEIKSDIIQCTLWSGIAESTVKHCKKDEMLAVKGRLQMRTYQDKEGKKIYVTEVIVERVTFMN